MLVCRGGRASSAPPVTCRFFQEKLLMRFAAGRHPASEVRGKVCSSRKRAEADGTMPGMAFPR